MKHDAIIMQFDTVLPSGGLALNALTGPPCSRKMRKQRNLNLESNPVKQRNECLLPLGFGEVCNALLLWQEDE